MDKKNKEKFIGWPNVLSHVQLLDGDDILASLYLGRKLCSSLIFMGSGVQVVTEVELTTKSCRLHNILK